MENEELKNEVVSEEEAVTDEVDTSATAGIVAGLVERDVTDEEIGRAHV